MKTISYNKNYVRIGLTLGPSYIKKIGKKAFNLPWSPTYMETIRKNKLADPHYVKVRNIQTCICGSDISMYTIHQAPSMTLAVMPAYKKTFLGHETVGVVEDIGPAVTSVAVGDRVVMRKYLPNCATKGIPEEQWCDHCKHNDYVMCENMGEAPLEPTKMTGAGMGDYYLAHESCVMKIEDCVSDDYACLYEPAAVSLHTVLKKVPNPGDKVIVLGGGMIGLNIVQFVKLMQPDCTVYVLEKAPMKQELALKLGADKIIKGNPYEFIQQETGAKYYTNHSKSNQVLINGVDQVYDSIGASWAYNMGLRMLKPHGTYIKAGIQMTTMKYDETPIWNQELTVMGVNSYGLDQYEGETWQTFDLVNKLVMEGKVNLDGFITAKFPVEEFRKGFSKVMFDGDNTIKVALTCNTK